MKMASMKESTDSLVSYNGTAQEMKGCYNLRAIKTIEVTPLLISSEKLFMLAFCHFCQFCFFSTESSSFFGRLPLASAVES
jgi:hypothetical protein